MELGKEFSDEEFERVAQAATTLINEHGWRSVNLKEVANEAGVGYRQLRQAVLDEEGLLTLVLEHRDVSDIEKVRAVREHSSFTPQRMLHELVQHNSSQPEIIRLYSVLQGEAVEESHPAHEYFARRYREAVDIMADIVKDVVADPDTTGVQIIAMMDGLQNQWLRERGTFDLVAEWDKAAAKILV